MTQHRSPQSADWLEAIRRRLSRTDNRPLKLRALARELGIDDAQYTTFRAFIRERISAGELALGPGRTIRLPASAGRLTGVFRANRRGFGFVERPGQPDVFVAPDDTGGAFDGDVVRIRIQKAGKRGLGPRAVVLQIIERAVPNWVGVLERFGTVWEVRPQGRNPLPTVQVDNAIAVEAQPGELVAVEPDERTLGRPVVRGRIVRRFGSAHDTHAIVHSIIYRHNIPTAFSDEAREVAARAAATFDSRDCGDREDFRELLTVTIDPVDARDFDDAISVELLDHGHVRLGVHIADVAHFVPVDSALDRDARRRGNSVYFPGVVVPMLPEALSNDVCSLRPGEPRFTQSVFITYDRQAEVVDVHLGRSIIRSRARLTYELASAALAGQQVELEPDVITLLRRAETLARRIHARRLKQGMIVLNVPEVEIRLDGRGQATDAGPADASFSHTIIEMFMVEANEAVARHLRDAGFEPIRRVHPPPEPHAATSLRPLSIVLGRMTPAELDRDAIRALLDSVRGAPAERTVNHFLLRAMAQAVYSTDDAGHFALASRDYCHFTSPIRRYADLTVHRMLNDAADRRNRDGADVCELGSHLTARERRALTAERAAKAALMLQVMRRQLGEVFDAVVIGITTIGAYVQVRPFLADGLVRVHDFGPDEWLHERDLGLLHSVRSSRRLYVGLAVRVRVAAIDEIAKELLLTPEDVRKWGEPAGKRAVPSRRREKGRPRRRK